ncbi:hypothetical protein Clacol_008578 [Clathrus columnatus]|uniref:non-specific serine/threonine protein kinase n=1 Tax=Clathrus columnatus TaxID=1419009 RepID=A0AAV5AMG3_9AGAM|nr:hypothetical protein Clacol_008578 [Clathrus columnatus]
MTDIPSGLKRPYEGEHNGSWKRRRDEDMDKTRSKDWREVHLKKESFRRDNGRDRSRDGRSRGGYHRDDDYRRRQSRDYDRHRDRDRDRPRDGDRERDRSRDKIRDRDRYEEKNGDRHRRFTRDSRRYRSQSRPVEDRKSVEVDVAELSYKDRESEMEEGEIVSVPPPPRRERSRERTLLHATSPKQNAQTPDRNLELPKQPVPQESPIRRPPSPKPPSPPKPVEPLPQPEIDVVVPEEEPSIEEQMAARRARREAIRAKYAANGLSTASQLPRELTPVTGMRPMVQNLSLEDERMSQPPQAKDVGTPDQSRPISRSTSPAADATAFSLAKDEPDDTADPKPVADGEQISAADYDPNQDRKEDEERRVRDIIAKNGLHEDNAMDVVEEVVEEAEEEEEDLDDMFMIASNKTKKKKTVKVTKRSTLRPVIATSTLDSAADPEGYYQIILGEQLDGGRYQVFSSLGKGMFSNVVRARILDGEGSDIGKDVAIKIVRAQESMHRAGLKEVQILNKLRQADPDDKKHIVRLERTFEHRGHLCLVFENLSMNLRDVIKRFGKDIGLNIRAVRAYTSQLFLALSLLRKSSIMHADIKPDNILVSENKTVLKVCDFGSASDVSENDITPYLVSRFYRAPEIILGLPYDTAIDVWSIGCTLYELYTGKILFPGRSNNQMLLLIMEVKGRFNSKIIKKAKFGDLYFDEMGGFVSLEKDKVTGLDVTRTLHISKPTRDLRARLGPPPSAKLKDDETKMVLSFIDLLDKCLTLDPARRLTPRDALMHPFVRGV